MNFLRIKKISFNYLEYLFPHFCVGCEKEGDFLCQKCRGDILEVEMQVCPDCGRLNPQGIYCRECRTEEVPQSKKAKKSLKKKYRRKPLQGIIAALYFEEGPTKEIIHNFKYNSVLEFKTILADKMSEKIKVISGLEIISFAPLHPKRFAQRGYNQSEILAQEISKQVKIPCQNLLIKNKKTKRQVGLKGFKRRKNLQGVFKVNMGIDIKGKKIVIIDDISTTGTTLNECARVLKKAGAREVWGLVVARG